MATQTAESMECGDGAATQQPATVFVQGAALAQQYVVIGDGQRIAMQAPPAGDPARMMPPSMPPPPRLPDNPYCRLCNFEIEKKIGRGQFSVVYRARCKLNNQIVALKKIQVRYR